MLKENKLARDVKYIRSRYDAAVVEIARLAAQGYAVIPLSVKLVGIVLYATLEINTEQRGESQTVTDNSEQPKGSSVVDEVQNGDVAPVTASIKTSKQTKAKASKDA